MQRDDAAYLLDILIAARKAVSYLNALSFSEFESSDLHQDAVMRALEIMGEAANRLSESTKEAHSEIPWFQVIGMRNRLVHEYFRINLLAVWDTIKNDIPELIEMIEPLLPDNDEYQL